MRRKLAVALLVATLGLAGCAAKPHPGPTVTRSFAPGDLVLRVDVQPSMVPASWRFAHVPTVSVYGDGRVITQAPQPATYPGPALPALQVQRITTAQVRQLVDRATAAGVGSGQDLGNPVITDAPSTHFALLADTGVVQTTVTALGMAADDSLTASERAGRTALNDFVTTVSDLTKAFGSVPPPVAYRPATVVAVAQDWADPADVSGPGSPPVTWPGPALPGKYVGMGLTCVTATGSDGVAVMAAAANANAVTPWMSAGARWRLTLRPLLPDETGCLDLGH